MLTAVDMRAAGASRMTREYLAGVVAAIRAVEPRRQMVVFTESGDENPVAGTSHYPLARGGARQPAAKAGAEVLLAPLTAAVPDSGAAQLLFTAELGALPGGDDGWRDRRRLARLQQAVTKGTRLVVPWESLIVPAQKQLGLPLDRIHAIPPGVDPAFEAPRTAIVSGSYIVFVASPSVTNAQDEDALLAALLERFSEAIVVVGRSGPLPPAFDNDRVLQIEYCAPSHLSSVFQHAQLVLLAGTAEEAPFAVLPPLIAGARVVTPRIAPVQEVAGDAVIFVERHSLGGVLDAVERALTEPSTTRQERVRRGRQLVRQFTWPATAWKVLNLVQRLEKEQRG
jgi:hypothetical protein